MVPTIKVLATYRVQVLADSWRVLWLNLRYGWITQQQRQRCFESGYSAVQSASHRPPNPWAHPLLHQDFEEGADLARDDFRIEDDEAYLRGMQSTYAAIEREEMEGIIDECRELGILPELRRDVSNRCR